MEYGQKKENNNIPANMQENPLFGVMGRWIQKALYLAVLAIFIFMLGFLFIAYNKFGNGEIFQGIGFVFYSLLSGVAIRFLFKSKYAKIGRF